MKNFHIEYPDEGLREALIDKINNLVHWAFWKTLHCKSD